MKLNRRTALGLLLAAGCLISRAGFVRADATRLDTLLDLIEARLAIMPDVARHKYNSDAPVEDLPREAQVIAAVTELASQSGIDKDLAARFFQAQIDASKIIQTSRIAAWKAESHQPFGDVPDLR